MIDVTRTTQVARPLTAVVEYLADFTHAERWDPGTIRCQRIDEGPIRVGARWHNVSKFRGNETEIEYTLSRLEPARVTFTGENKTVSTVDDISFAEDGEQTHITYAASFSLHGVASLAQPFIKGDLARLGDETIAELRTVLEDAIEVGRP